MEFQRFLNRIAAKSSLIEQLLQVLERYRKLVPAVQLSGVALRMHREKKRAPLGSLGVFKCLLNGII